MNKPNPTDNFRAAPDAKKSEGGDQKKPTPKQAEQQGATRADLVMLHKRMVEMFTTLKDGLGHAAQQKAAEDRVELCDRLDDVERSVNTMEGMLRIELLPQIDAVVKDALEERKVGRVNKISPLIFGILIAAAGIGAGAFWSTPILETAAAVLGYFSSIF